LLARHPLSRLMTVDHYPLRREWSERLGAHASLHPDDDILAHLQADSPYAGADLTYELSGSPAALNQAIDITGYNGRILVGSWYGQKQAPLNLGGRFHRSHMRLISSQVSHIAPQWSGRWSKTRRMQIAWQMLANLRPERLVTHRFSFANAAAAYRLLDEQPETAVQVLLTYDTETAVV
ncbi:MAG: zinc-binding alcohol dehydrogenase, partial [Anaerolineales bacterium]|nr:zinc-binding alcohol dehydrogenase [Anaerolineales bacterium]